MGGRGPLDTDNAHTHVVLRDKDDTGKDLIIARDNIAEGMRHRARELATEQLPCTWAVHANAGATLRAMGERGDIIGTLQRAMGGRQRDLAVFESGEQACPVIGRVDAKGLADELYDKGYLVIDGADGKAHYVALPPRTDLEQFPAGAVVVKGAAEVRAADKTIASLAAEGLYRTDQHLAPGVRHFAPLLDHFPGVRVLRIKDLRVNF